MTPPVIRLLAPVAIKTQLAGLIAAFTAAGGAEVEMAVALNPDIPRRITDGEACDLAICNPWYIDDLIAAGALLAEGHAPFGRVPLAIGRRGAGDAPLTDHDAIRGLLLGAASIGYTGAGTSGKTFLDMCARIGVLDRIAPHARPIGAGEPVRACAAGEVALAIAPLTTVIAAPGVEVAAILPPDLGADIDMSMALAPGARPQAAALLRHLADPALDAGLAATGVLRFSL